jgi:hypothetical protein
MIIDPNAYDRAAHWNYGQRLAEAWVKRNGLRMPRITARVLSSYGRCTGGDSILVHYDRCRAPTKTPVRSWQFPGYKADLSVAGVTTHELGHAVDHQLGYPSRGWDWRAVIEAEAAVTSYEPNSAEAWAEAFRLFGCNPDLLRLGRPKRYAYFTQETALHPVVDLTSAEILCHAHPKYESATAGWIARGHARRRK